MGGDWGATEPEATHKLNHRTSMLATSDPELYPNSKEPELTGTAASCHIGLHWSPEA